ncbi:YlzJ-like family protein [Alkalihalobacillus sp. AL-G]|uniref:YlzJ-like family protein n=1 Tax=Alkalihalobacillus sp. AL-G TaxID=2926399 RepID=UPI002729F851|nr:YlzJ-like family protein [Alkalihalobacillus sp. AL-G]WLD95209.1 YlzJ-like family protein [Alkalihalobacillus sp. AL-G]
MILYTVMPHEFMFESKLSDYEKQSVIELNGVPVMVERMEDQNCRIVRMMSTDPTHFMNPNLQPGTILKMSYTWE